jgi:hypothetical protein
VEPEEVEKNVNALPVRTLFIDALNGGEIPNSMFCKCVAYLTPQGVK